MKSKFLSTVFYFSILLVSCTTIRTIDYFKLTENKIETYNGIFIKNPMDNNYRQIEQTYGSISKSDAIIEKTEIIYKTLDIEGHKAFYAIETKDTLRENPNIGSWHFLFSTMIFDNDTIFVAPINKKAELKKMRFIDFKYKIPPSLTKKDSVVIINGKGKWVLNNFHKTTLLMGNKNFSDCLEFEIREVWPGTIYQGKVWLHKKYGLLKWIRSSGRIETRAF